MTTAPARYRATFTPVAGYDPPRKPGEIRDVVLTSTGEADEEGHPLYEGAGFDVWVDPDHDRAVRLLHDGDPDPGLTAVLRREA